MLSMRKARKFRGKLMTELEARERNRRYALWELVRLNPGSDQAKPHLAILDDIERRDRDEPIGEAWAMSIDELREHVPETEILGREGFHFVIVLDQDIPELWKSRFVEASSGSTRLIQGSFARDWRKFLHLWEFEMKHIEAHRSIKQDNS
jgi:hypothetical protein